MESNFRGNFLTFISGAEGWILLVGFGIAMILITYFVLNREKDRSLNHTKEGFLLANRQVSWLQGGPSIAASWIWAGALFVATQMAYEKGLAGLFWFLVPNVLALLIFAVIGPHIREKFNTGYTLPQYIRHTVGSKWVHRLYLVPFFFGQMMAITFNIFAGSAVISFFTGLDVLLVMPTLVLIALAYTWLGGLKASVITDVVQLAAIIIGILIFVPWTLSAGGGFQLVLGGFSGVQHIDWIFDPGVAFSFGIVTSIGLISQTISDQQYWQRVFAIKKQDISKAFIFGAILFGLIPLILSLLGFFAANPASGISLPQGLDPSMIGVVAVTNILPIWGSILFVIILLSGLSSTVDSAISAASSLYVTDIKKHGSIGSLSQNGVSSDAQAISQARTGMILICVLGLAFAYGCHFIAGFGVKQLFLLTNSIAASISIPTILTLYWNRLHPDGMLVGILGALVIGMPAFFYANYLQNDGLIVASSLFMIGFSTLSCWVFRKKRPSFN